MTRTVKVEAQGTRLLSDVQFTKMKNRKIIIATSIGLLILSPFLAYEVFLFCIHEFNPDYNKIDRCLDRGGKWDYENRICIFEESTDMEIEKLIEPVK